MPTLLARDGTADNERQGKLGILMHDTGKWMIRNFIRAAHKKLKPVIAYKLENGWLNPHIEQLYKDWGWAISLDEREDAKKHLFGFAGGDNDKNKVMFYQLRDIVCVMLDEDTHYSMRVMMTLFRIHENWEEHYEIPANQSNLLFRYREIYERMKDLKDVDDLDKLELPVLEPEGDDTEDENEMEEDPD